MQVLLARTKYYKNEYNSFTIAPILEKYGLDVNFVNSHILSTVPAAYSTGISINNNPSAGYKKILNRILLNLVAMKQIYGMSYDKIIAISKDYMDAEFGNTNNLQNQVNDMMTKDNEITNELLRAEVFIKNQNSLGKDNDFIQDRLSALYPMYTKLQEYKSKVR